MAPEQKEAFDKLVDLCMTTPVLAFVDFKKLFKLYIDASAEGLGAVLYQEQDGKERVVAFASRRLSKSRKIIQCSNRNSWRSSGQSQRSSLTI